MLLPTQDKEARLTDEEIRKAIEHHMIGGDPCYSGYIWPMRSVCEAQLVKLQKLGYHKGLPPSIGEALNSGDGAYRP